MGEKDERICEGEKKKSKGEKKMTATDGGDGGKNKEEAGQTIILKLDLHCDGCAKKVKRSIKNYNGVEEVKVDSAGGKLTVKGNVDANWLRDKVEQKTKKKVELINVSSQPNKDAGGGDKKPAGDKVKEIKKPVDDKVKENKSEEKVKEMKKTKHDDDKKPKENKSEGSTVVLKIPLHCDGCAQKIRRIIKKLDGVENVSIDNDKDLVTMEGTMDMKELLPYLKEKLKRSVDIVSPKKDDGVGGGGDKKGKEGGGGENKKEKTGGGDKKEKAAGGDKDKKEKAIGGGGGEEKNEKVAVGGEDKKEKAAGGGEDKKEKTSGGGGDKKDKDGGGDGKGKKEKEVGGGGKKEKGNSGGGDEEKKEKAGGGSDNGGTGGGDKQIDESKDGSNGRDKTKDNIEEPKFEVNKMEYQGYGTPHTHYDLSLYNQSYANQDYGLHTTYNPYNHHHASTSYVMEYNQPYHHLHHLQPLPPHVPPLPPPTYLPPPQDNMFSDENPNACSMM